MQGDKNNISEKDRNATKNQAALSVIKLNQTN